MPDTTNTSLHDKAVKILNGWLRNRTGLEMDDLPDTNDIWSIVDHIEGVMESHDFNPELPIREAVECCAEILDYLDNDVSLDDLM